MARFKKCTDKDISILLDTSESDAERSDKCYKPRIRVVLDDNSNTSSSEPIFNNNKSLLLRNNKLRKEQASLRLKLRRSTEQSVYKIDTDSEPERPKRLTRSGKYLRKLQDENEMPRKRAIKLPMRYRADEKKEEAVKRIENESSDSDCTCVKIIQTPRSARSSRLSKKTEQHYVPSVENNGSPITPRVTRLSKRKTLDEEVLANRNTSANNLKTNTTDTSLNSTPEKRPRTRSSKIVSVTRDKYGSKMSKDKDEDKVDEITAICLVTKDLSIKTPKKNRNVKDTSELPIKQNGLSTPKTPKSRVSLKHSALTPSVRRRTMVLLKPTTPLQEVRSKLHVNAVPKSLPCREEEFNNIYTFLNSKLMDNTGGCIYISGVPGTGKTATVNEVIKCLQKSVEKGKLKYFDFVEINGMKLSEPRQAYVQILKQLSGQVLMWEQAQNTLEKRFKSKAKRPMTLLLVDELDLLCTKRQDVVYNLLDWPTKVSAQLVVITIANTMDLPEKVLMGRVTSRLGLTRVSFQPYNHKQLQEIVLTRLKDSDIFKNEAIQLIARKVSAVSGDARRALDICRRATEISETRDGSTVTMEDVTQALSEMIANPKVQAIKHCSMMEQVFLQAVCAEVTRTGVEEVCFRNIYKQFESLCSFDGLQVPNISETFGICARLASSRLLICENSRDDIYQRILLNISKDDVYYALRKIDLD